MMKLQTYAGISLVAILAIVYHAFSSRGQFYPAMVYMSTSKISLVLLLNMGLVIMYTMWQLTRKLFLGSLREAEVERLNEQSWEEFMKILAAIVFFKLDCSVSFLAMVTAMLLIKALHWLAQKRVEYIETAPSVPMLSHVRIASFLGFLLVLDTLFLYSSISNLIRTQKVSVSLFFSFEYMILATTTEPTFVKYVFYVIDMLMEGQWEKKPVYTFYLEFFRDLLHLSMYFCFFLMIFRYYGVPLHLIREFYETFRNFRIRIADYIRYRKLTSNMDNRFPDATPEELNASDATCIICCEEMTTAKKLLCGHLFHVDCLRSWFERQHTCPTCRALVVPPDSGTGTAGRDSGSRSDDHQQGTGTTAQGGGVAGDNVSQHEARLRAAADNVSQHEARFRPPAADNVSQHEARLGTAAAAASASIYEKSYVYPSANMKPGSELLLLLHQHEARLRAAAAAASIYEKSYVYPSANRLVWSPGYAAIPQVQRHTADSSNTESSGESSIGQSQPQLAAQGGAANLSISQFPPYMFVPGANVANGERLGSDPNLTASQLETQNQIEILQNQLQVLQKPKPEESVDMGPTTASLDGKGKSVAASSSVSDCGRH